MVENPGRKRPHEVPSVVEWMILKWMFENGMRGFRLNLFDPLQHVAVADFCYQS